MNIKGKMKRIQSAILSYGLVIGIHQRQFYSDDKKCMITIYKLTTPVCTRGKDGKWKKAEHKILDSASVMDVFQCLLDIFEAVRHRE